MSKPEVKTAKLEVGLPAAGFPRCMYFNVFRVEREKGFHFLQTGLVTSLGIIDTYECVVTEMALEQNKESVMAYLGRLGPSQSTAPSTWKGATIENNVDVVDILHMSYRGAWAEMVFYTFSVTAATRLGRDGTSLSEVQAQPMILLRCEADVQRDLIASLYE
jgi:hypothetical protein